MSAAAWRQPHRQPQRRACRHKPQCPVATADDAHAARVVDARPEQGWYLLCNGIVRWADDRTASARRAQSGELR